MHGHTPLSNANNFRGEDSVLRLKVNGQKTKVESQKLKVNGRKVKHKKLNTKPENQNEIRICKDRSTNDGPTNAPMLKIEGQENKKSIVCARQTIDNLTANALEFLYLHIIKM